MRTGTDQWEYDKVEFMDGDTNAILELLNAKGAEGWEQSGSNAFPVSGTVKSTGQTISGMLFVIWMKRKKSRIHLGTPDPQFINGG